MSPPPTRKADHGPAHRLRHHLRHRHVGGSALRAHARAPGAPARTPPPPSASGRTDTHSHDANADPQGTPARPRQHRPGNRTGQDAAPTATHSPRHTPRRRRHDRFICDARRARIEPVRLHRRMHWQPAHPTLEPLLGISAQRPTPLRHTDVTDTEPVRRNVMHRAARRRLLRRQRQHPQVRPPRNSRRPRTSDQLTAHATRLRFFTAPDGSVTTSNAADGDSSVGSASVGSNLGALVACRGVPVVPVLAFPSWPSLPT